ncbi:hypothetical protein wVul_1703 [Wolbachia endosymbiont of Armadillidium vulgare str. wVulC]|nr:hypothetical protein wVul_1703 [Wolbachia endosymbiont of Armadillidium vulgare str. wVulC]
MSKFSALKVDILVFLYLSFKEIFDIENWSQYQLLKWQDNSARMQKQKIG